MRILIVDDSSATRTFLRETLEARTDEGAPIEVSEADGGLEALRLLPRGPYDLVITDINMSGVNGLELLNFIKGQAKYQGTRVVLISTQTSAKDRQRGLDLGADAFLPKPFSEQQLRGLVAQLLGRGDGGG